MVRKEMYDFDDKGGRHIALRPEGTASVVRAFVQHQPAAAVEGLVRHAGVPLRARAGRPVPPAPPGRPRGPRLRRPRPRRRGHRAGLGVPARRSACARSSWCSTRWAPPTTASATSRCSAPSSQDRIGDLGRGRPREGRAPPHAGARLQAHRDHAGPPPTRPASPTTSRPRARTTSSGCRPASTRPASRSRSSPGSSAGFDYYTHTTFEFVPTLSTAPRPPSAAAAATTAWSRSSAARPRPASASARASSALLLACDAEGVFPGPDRPLDVFVVDVTGGDQARDLTAELRAGRHPLRPRLRQQVMRAQMKAADRSGAALAVIVGEQELADGTRHRPPAARRVRRATSSRRPHRPRRPPRAHAAREADSPKDTVMTAAAGLRTDYCGELRPTTSAQTVVGLRLGGQAPRARRAPGLRRPPRPHRRGPVRRRRRRRPAHRVRAAHHRHRRAPARGHRQPQAATGEVELAGLQGRDPLRGRAAAVPARRPRRRRRRDGPPAVPLPRPAPRAHAAQPARAGQGQHGHPPVDGATRASSRSRRRCSSPLARPRAPATSWCPAASSPASSTPCPRARSCSSSC